MAQLKQGSILFLKHVRAEGPGTLLGYLKRRKIAYKILDLWRGEALPKSLNGIGLVVSLGGPMNVYEEDKYPFLKMEDNFIKQIIKKKVNFLGICLGAQLLAKAAGGRVYKAGRKETGWSRVKLTGSGENDRLFKGLPDELPVFQWHGDTFSLPPSGRLLVSGGPVANQAIRVGEKAYGLQFHIEIDKAKIAGWFKGSRRKNEFIKRYLGLKSAYQRNARKVYRNLLRILLDDHAF